MEEKYELISAEQVFDDIIGCLVADPVAAKNLLKHLKELPGAIPNYIFLKKLEKFLLGVKSIEGNPQAVKMSVKLLSGKDREENGFRIISLLEKIETLGKIDYINNATRSLLMRLIDNADYFRICKAIVETLDEDLCYLSNHVVEFYGRPIPGNMNMLALARSGLAISAGIDGDQSPENQEYTFTKLGGMVVLYSIMVDNDELRCLMRKESDMKFYPGFEKASEEDVERLFENIQSL